MSLEDALNNFAKEAEKMAVPNHKTRKRMTAAGAKVLADRLKQVTKSEHYQESRKIDKVKHLADSIVAENTDIDGTDNGNSVVGFEGPKDSGINHARIARFLNDGTVKIRGDHFVDDTRREATDDIFEAQRKIYRGEH